MLLSGNATLSPGEDFKWPYGITRLTVHVVCGLVSDPVIQKRREVNEDRMSY